MARVLVVDDEQSMREFLQILLEREGHDVETAGDVRSGMEACKVQPPDLIYSDLKLPDGSGMELLKFVRDAHPEIQVIMLTAFGTTENAVEAMRLGAYDYQIKPVKVDEIRVLTQKALEKTNLIRDNKNLSDQLKSRLGLSRFVGTSRGMREVLELVAKVAPTKTNVLIEGESGTGKELVARAIHEASPRARGPFVPVNCGAIPETLLEAELFGHQAGAFTGASQNRPGLFEAAYNGTLLLDEIGELPMHVQVKLLRVIQERTVRRIGEDRERPVDVRIVAATNRDLQGLVAEGNFREDLFYRLNVVRVRVPPLRERPEDIPLLARAFALKYAQECGKHIEGISNEAMSALCRYQYPGNVRELENHMERAVALLSGAVIDEDALPEEVRQSPPASNHDILIFPEDGLDLEQTLGDIERHFIREALKRTGGNKTRAAELVGLSFRSFRYRLQKLDLGES